MKIQLFTGMRGAVAPLIIALVAGCSSSSTPTPTTTPATPTSPVPMFPPVAAVPVVPGVPGAAVAPTIQNNTTILHPNPDPRVGLKAGTTATGPDAWGEASWNMRLLSLTPPSEKFVGVTNSDLAFTDHYVIQGNYNGFQIFDVANPRMPTLVHSGFCPASQSDVSVYGKLLFVSAEATSARLDCGPAGNMPAVSKDRIRGIRIFDISDIKNPKYIANVQSCRGSHTHTVVTSPKDKDNVYVYISGTSSVRSEEEVKGCIASPDDPNTATQRLEVIKVPLKDPTKAAIVSAARLFAGLAGAPRRGAAAQPAGGAPAPAGRGPSQCHDITTYPAAGLAGGACSGHGILFDITDPANPKRITSVTDTNLSVWHSATFSNDGKRVLFSDEQGGGSGPVCQAQNNRAWGADAFYTIENRATMKFQSYYKLPAPQTAQENCVSHNGSPIPIPGREVMVQGWYQGGLSVFDWTDPAHVVEIAFFDRGPLTGKASGAGSWSAYWYNGLIYSSELARGMDVYELTPSPLITQNEIDAAKTIWFKEFNAQEQAQFVYPPSFPLSKAYVDQLQRSKGLSEARLTAVRNAIAGAEQATGGARKTALNNLANSLSADMAASSDKEKLALLTTSLKDLAKK